MTKRVMVELRLNDTEFSLLVFYTKKYKISQRDFLALFFYLLKDEAMRIGHLERLIGIPYGVTSMPGYQKRFSRRIVLPIPIDSCDWIKNSWKKDRYFRLFLNTLDPLTSHPRHLLRGLVAVECFLKKDVFARLEKKRNPVYSMRSGIHRRRIRTSFNKMESSFKKRKFTLNY